MVFYMECLPNIYILVFEFFSIFPIDLSEFSNKSLKIEIRVIVNFCLTYCWNIKIIRHIFQSIIFLLVLDKISKKLRKKRQTQFQGKDFPSKWKRIWSKTIHKNFNYIRVFLENWMETSFIEARCFPNKSTTLLIFLWTIVNKIHI